MHRIAFGATLAAKVGRMFRPLVVVLVLILSTIIAFAQSDSDKLPLVSIGGSTNAEAVSDINAQLIWLLAATAKPGERGREEYMDAMTAGMLIRVSAFGTLDQEQQQKLASILSQFRSTHDSLAADYNSRISEVGRESVGKEYQDFRVKVNDLVADTMRTLNSTFPDSAASLHSTMQNVRKNTFIASVRGSNNIDYASDPNTAATGFAYIQGAVVNSASFRGEKLEYITVVMIGMVPGCPGQPFPTVNLDSMRAEGPKIGPLEYMNYQTMFKTTAERAQNFMSVKCSNPIPR